MYVALSIHSHQWLIFYLLISCTIAFLFPILSSIFFVLVPQFTVSFPRPLHPVNQALTMTMANKSIYTSHPCPRCGNGNYPSMRSLTIHLNTCSDRFGLLPNAKMLLEKPGRCHLELQILDHTSHSTECMCGSHQCRYYGMV